MPIPSLLDIQSKRDTFGAFGESGGEGPVLPGSTGFAEGDERRRMIELLASRSEDEWMALAAQKSLRSFNSRMYPNYVRSAHIDMLTAALEKAIDTPNYRLIVTMPPRHSKRISDDELILTQNRGWTIHGELTTDDVVFGPDGSPRRVVWIDEPGPIDYTVTFSNGEKIKCHGGHLWTVYDRSHGTYNGSGWRTVTTSYLASQRIFSGDRCRFQLPSVDTLVFPTQDLPCDPYALGVWLGDGTRGTPVLNMDLRDDGVPAELERRGYPRRSAQAHPTTGVIRSSFAGPKNGNGGSLSRLGNELQSAGVYLEKHIPEEYLRSSIDQRLDLLSGLMDTDGYVDIENGRCRFINTNRALLDGVYDLATTLGFKPYLMIGDVPTSGFGGNLVSGAVGFNPTIPLRTVLPRRQIRRFPVERRIGIVSIDPLPEPTIGRCIQVDHPDGLYLVGRTLIPTHNSLHVSEHLPAFYLGRNPDRRVMQVSHTADLAFTFSRRVRNKILDPRWPFPLVTVAGDKSAVKAWDIAGHLGGYLAVGVGGSPAGHGANLIIIDDPIGSIAIAESEASREALWEWYQGTIRDRLEPGGSMIVTATRWHEEDLTGHLLEEMRTGGEIWNHLHLPALRPSATFQARRPRSPSEGGGPSGNLTNPSEWEALWPERWPVEALLQIKKAVGTRVWEARFQGRPSPMEGGLLQRSWWRFYRSPPVKLTGHIMSADMSFRETKEGSYVVYQIWACLGADRYLLDQLRFRADFPAAKAAFERFCRKWPQARTKLVENKANGPAIVASLRHDISGIVEINPVGGKLARASAISPQVEAGNVYLPDPELNPWVYDFIEECASFPHGSNNDQVDAMSQALSRLEQHTAPSSLPTIIEPRQTVGRLARLGGLSRGLSRSFVNR